MREFKRRPIRAVQFTKEMRDGEPRGWPEGVMAVDYSVVNRRTMVLEDVPMPALDTGDDAIPIHDGDWIVHGTREDGMPIRMVDEAFKALYEENT